MEGLRIILGSVAAAVLYGVLQDQVTARVCVEYFTIGHPDLFGTNSPTLLGLSWGVAATWWAGLALGIPLAVAARAGRHPRRTLRDLAPAIGRLLLTMGGAALVAGVLGYIAARNDWIWLTGPYASMIPEHRHALFLADGAAHSMVYAVGFLGGATVCVRTWLGRRREG